MAKTRTWFLGIGCVVLLLGLALIILVMQAVRGPSLERELILALRLSGPLPEVAAEDPFAELAGEQVLGLRDLRNALTRAAEDDRVKGVRLRVDGFQGFSTAQEIRGLLDGMRKAGKWTAAYMDTAGEFAPGNIAYYLASSCDDVSLNPLGDVNLIGLSARSPFIRGTLDKLGIKPEFPGRGDYKSARFFYTQRDFTPAHREMTEWLLESLTDQLAQGIAASRGIGVDEVRYLIDHGPYLGEEAAEARLVDHIEDWDGFVRRIKARESDRPQVVGPKTYLRRSRGRSGGHKIAVVTAVGGIMRGRSGRDITPIFGGDVMGADTIAKALRDARETSGVKAVIFRIDSPGGSALASEIIRTEMVRTSAKVPVVVSMANVAGSGGYWITCGSQRIVANPGTITGSIGVLAGHLNMDAFWADKMGVTFGRIDMGTNANIYGTLEDWTDEQRAVADRVLDRIYDHFLELVAASRGMGTDAVDAVGRGRVFTGEQAAANGLVDVLGGFDVALDEARRLAGIAPDARVRLVEYPRLLPWWQEMLQRRSDEEVSLGEALDTLDQSWRRGVLSAPGLVWMPPIHVE